MESTITSKGQITVPKALRDRLHLKTGDRVAFVVGADNTVRVVAKHRSVQHLKGCLPKPAKPVSLEEMDRAIGEGATERG